ncbi:MAG: hypothetical protein P8Y47_06635, partial [Alphaproteobacteria bacterium]
MTGNSAHVSQYQFGDGCMLTVVEDEEKCAELLIAAEQTVAQKFSRYGKWPHRQVNLFVFENLQPLIEKLGQASRTLGENKESADNAYHGLENKPMVHAYNPADLKETSIFVNRGQLQRLGLWDNAEVLEGLLAHEHAHPLSENVTTLTARNLRVTISPAAPTNDARQIPASANTAKALETLAHELCLHAPHEVFANELVIRAGLGAQLFALNRQSLTGGRAGIEARIMLEARLQAEVAQGRLSMNDVALTLLLASLEAYTRVALETAAFARAGAQEQADALNDLLKREAFRHIEPEVEDIY